MSCHFRFVVRLRGRPSMRIALREAAVYGIPASPTGHAIRPTSPPGGLDQEQRSLPAPTTNERRGGRAGPEIEPSRIDGATSGLPCNSGGINTAQRLEARYDRATPNAAMLPAFAIVGSSCMRCD